MSQESLLELFKMALSEGGRPDIAEYAILSERGHVAVPRVYAYSAPEVVSKAVTLAHQALKHDAHIADDFQPPGVCCHTCGRRDSCTREL